MLRATIPNAVYKLNNSIAMRINRDFLSCREIYFSSQDFGRISGRFVGRFKVASLVETHSVLYYPWE